MPTQLPRLQVTITEEVAAAIEVAGVAWPDVPRAQLVARLLDEGARSIRMERERASSQKRDALVRLRGIVAYPPGYLEDLRGEWPE